SVILMSGGTGRRIGEDEAMRYMLLQNYGPSESDCPPMSQWSPADIKAHIEFQQALNAELLDRGELVDAQGLAGPEQARFGDPDGPTAPATRTARFPESKELLAGSRIVDVASDERAVEIAARISAAPGPAGAPIRLPIEVRVVMSAPDPEV